MKASPPRPRSSSKGSPPQPSTSSVAAPRGAFGPIKAIAWAFLGIRGNGARERDAVQVSPLVWIGTGLAAVVVLVLVLMGVVHWLVPTIT